MLSMAKNKGVGPRRIRSALTGFTFVELMMVIAIVAVTIPSLLSSFVSVTLLNETNNNYGIAITHAQYVMEDIRDADFIGIKAKIESGDWDWNSAAINNNGLAPLANENINTEVSGTDLLNITVIVNWIDRGGRQKNTQLVTLISGP